MPIVTIPVPRVFGGTILLTVITNPSNPAVTTTTAYARDGMVTAYGRDSVIVASGRGGDARPTTWAIRALGGPLLLNTVAASPSLVIARGRDSVVVASGRDGVVIAKGR